LLEALVLVAQVLFEVEAPDVWCVMVLWLDYVVWFEWCACVVVPCV